MKERLEELIKKCNVMWSDDFLDGKRHIRGKFTEEEKKEFFDLYNKLRGLYLPIDPLLEIVIDE